MSKFDFMEFSANGDATEWVCNKNKFTKKEAIECFMENADWMLDNGQVVTENDLAEKYVKFYVQKPEWCGYDGEKGGCYSYCKKETRGSFPVWVITPSLIGGNA